MQVYNQQHYTTLITDNNAYNYYDGLGIPVPNTITKLHNHLRQWYGSSSKPPVLQCNTPTVHTPYTPRQTDGWSCSMHMLLTSLSAIYQAKIPILTYGQRLVDQMSRAHLRYVLSGEISPWINKLVTYLSDPHNTEDPEPHNKTHIAGGTEIPEQLLAQKSTKKGKHNKQQTSHHQHTTSTTTQTRIHTHPTSP